ncbi:MAG: hypothetical protein ABI614_23225 [Planctomycetota bacterium]
MAPANDREQSPNDRRLNWARNELGLDCSAGTAETRRAFLTQVSDDDFAPDPAKLQAFELLQRESPGPSPLAYQAAERLRMKDRVEQLADRIFLLSPVERRAEWETLHAGCDDSPGASAVLERLEPALDLDFDQLQLQGDAAELAVHLRELFALPPVKRAERRAAVIELCKSDGRRWERVARNIASRHPNVAALDPPLIERLSSLSRSKKVMRRPPRVKGPPRVTVTKRWWNEDLSKHSWLLWICIVVLAQVGRLATTTSSRSAPSPVPVRVPDYQPFSQPQDATRINEAKRINDLLRRMEELSRMEQPTDDGMTPNKIWVIPPDATSPLNDEEMYQRIGELYIQDRANQEGSESSVPIVPLDVPTGADTP